MNLLLVIAGLLVSTQAKPSPKADIGLGYSYRPPATSYGIPSEIASDNSQKVESVSSTPSPIVSDVSSSQYVSSTPASISSLPAIAYVSSTPSPISFSTTPATNFQIPIRDFTSFTGGIQSIANIPLQTGTYPSSLFSDSVSANINYPGVLPNIYSNGNNLNLQGIANFAPGLQSIPVNPFEIQNRYNIENVNQESVTPEEDAQVEVSKHLYFYSSPEDIQTPQRRINLPRAPTKQNVKILFIKAPAVVTPPPIIIPAQKQNEEKTLVYVLVKKPEEAAPIEINTPPPTPPSKPEVYFIKYKTQKEAEEAISNIQRKQQQTANSGGIIQGVNPNNFAIQPNIQPNFAVQTIGRQDFPVLGNGFNTQGISITNNGALGLGPQLLDSTSTVSPIDTSSFSSNVPFVGRLTSSSVQVGPGQNINSGNSIPVNYPISNSFDVASRIDAEKIQGNSNGITVSSENVPNSNLNSGEISRGLDSIDSNEKALGESFGGLADSRSESEASNTISVSTNKPSGISNNVILHSTYGVPNKRGIRKLTFNLST